MSGLDPEVTSEIKWEDEFSAVVMRRHPEKQELDTNVLIQFFYKGGYIGGKWFDLEELEKKASQR